MIVGVGAGGRGRLVLVCGAVVAMLGGPVSADECSDYRAANVLYHAADKALTDFRDTLSLEDIRDSATKNEKLAPYYAALNGARRVREEAAIALRLTIDDEIAATAIDAILSAWVGIEQAYERVFDWNSRSPDSGNVGSRVRISAASFELQEAAWKAGRTYYFLPCDQSAWSASCDGHIQSMRTREPVSPGSCSSRLRCALHPPGLTSLPACVRCASGQLSRHS